LKDEGIDIVPGYETSIEVTRKLTKNLPQPFSKCVDTSKTIKSDLFGLIMASNQTYRQQ
jgi:hypothetical protein